jgi:hypothetical protein
MTSQSTRLQSIGQLEKGIEKEVMSDETQSLKEACLALVVGGSQGKEKGTVFG